MAPDLSIMVPLSGFEMLITADWLRRERPVFARCSRKLVRHLCKPYWQAGWCGRDIIHALDHRPLVFSQPSGILLSPDYPVSPAQFIRSRLRAWRSPDDAVLQGHWSAISARELYVFYTPTPRRPAVRRRHLSH